MESSENVRHGSNNCMNLTPQYDMVSYISPKCTRHGTFIIPLEIVVGVGLWLAYHYIVAEACLNRRAVRRTYVNIDPASLECNPPPLHV